MVVLLMFVDSLKSSMYFKGVPIARRNERPYVDKTGTVVRSGWRIWLLRPQSDFCYQKAIMVCYSNKLFLCINSVILCEVIIVILYQHRKHWPDYRGYRLQPCFYYCNCTLASKWWEITVIDLLTYPRYKRMTLTVRERNCRYTKLSWTNFLDWRYQLHGRENFGCHWQLVRVRLLQASSWANPWSTFRVCACVAFVPVTNSPARYTSDHLRRGTPPKLLRHHDIRTVAWLSITTSSPSVWTAESCLMSEHFTALIKFPSLSAYRSFMGLWCSWQESSESNPLLYGESHSRNFSVGETGRAVPRLPPGRWGNAPGSTSSWVWVRSTCDYCLVRPDNRE